MGKILLIDSELKSKWDDLYTELAHKLEFMDKWSDSDNEKMKERIKETCTPEILFSIQKKMREIEKTWNRGEIIL